MPRVNMTNQTIFVNMKITQISSDSCTQLFFFLFCCTQGSFCQIRGKPETKCTTKLKMCSLLFMPMSLEPKSAYTRTNHKKKTKQVFIQIHLKYGRAEDFCDCKESRDQIYESTFGQFSDFLYFICVYIYRILWHSSK